MDFCFVLLLLSFCIKTAEFDSIKCANCDNQQQNGNSSIFEELRQMYGKDQQMQVTKFICEADKIYGILEAIKTEKPICCNLAKNDEYNFIKKRITLINHNDPPLSQMMDTLIVKLMSVKKAMESENFGDSLIKMIKLRLKFAVKFVVKRHGIEFDERNDFNLWSKNGQKLYFSKWSKIFGKNGKKFWQNNSNNEHQNGNDQNKTKRFLQFVVKTIETCEDGTAKRRKNTKRRRKRAIFSNITLILVLILGFIFAAITLSYWQVICEDVINFINLTREALNNFQITRNDNTMLLDAFDQFPSIAVDNESDCAICLDQIHAGIHVKQLPSCEHIFHDECIKAWIQGGHNACPMCRQQLLAEAQNEHQMDGIASGAEMGNSSNDPSVIVQIDEAHQSETSDEEDEADQSAENTQMANMA